MESTLTLCEIGPVDGIITATLAEDLASGDVTGRVTVGPHTHWSARLVAKGRLVFAVGWNGDDANTERSIANH